MELKESVGQLRAKTDRLIANVKSQGKKIETNRAKMSLVAGGTIVIGFLFASIFALKKLLPIEMLVPR
jgi:hypothetical protein